MTRKMSGRCMCGCGDYYYPGTLQPQSQRLDGYIDGHEPEMDRTQYDAPLVVKEEEDDKK